jgi:hypothetical protein
LRAIADCTALTNACPEAAVGGTKLVAVGFVADDGVAEFSPAAGIGI